MEMDSSAQQVERNLAEASRNCNSRLLEKKAKNLRIFEERVGAGGTGLDPSWLCGRHS
jgi:conserved oligomeric Golgi complex subunit 1